MQHLIVFNLVSDNFISGFEWKTPESRDRCRCWRWTGLCRDGPGQGFTRSKYRRSGRPKVIQEAKKVSIIFLFISIGLTTCSTGNNICRKPSSLAVLSWNVRGPPFQGLTLTSTYSAAHDFYTTQPRHSADVFILRAILHGWSDAYALKILKHLRAAAKPETRLVVLEQIVLYACAQPTPEGIKGTSAGPPVPAPLLANMGYASLSGYLMDMQVRRVYLPLESV